MVLSLVGMAATQYFGYVFCFLFYVCTQILAAGPILLSASEQSEELEEDATVESCRKTGIYVK